MSSAYDIIGAEEEHGNFQSLLAQLHARSGGNPATTVPPSEYPANFNPFGHGGLNFNGQPDLARMGRSFSPSNNSPAYPPTAPTPPGYCAPTPPHPTASGDQTANLLSLLKYGSHAGQPAGSSSLLARAAPQQVVSNESLPTPDHLGPSSRNIIHAPAPTAADPSGLLAALIRDNLPTDAEKLGQTPPLPQPLTWNSSSPPSDTQKYLLNLLNRPKPSQSDGLADSDPSHCLATALTPPQIRDHQNAEQQNSANQAAPAQSGGLPHNNGMLNFSPSVRASVPTSPKFNQTPPSLQLASSPSSRPKFTYANPFDGLGSQAPIVIATTAAGLSSGPQAQNVPVKILKKSDPPQAERRHELPGGSEPAPNVTGEHDYYAAGNHSRPSPTAQTPDETEVTAAANAVSELMTMVGREMKETSAAAHTVLQYATATHETVMSSADVASPPVVELPEAVAKDHQVAEGSLTNEESSRAGHAPVADNWENVDVDDGPLADDDRHADLDDERAALVKVYNFPMKPWIAITIQDLPDATETRPEFRDEAILDIARLKRDFEPIDRNLLTASETYIAYGMSKAGGVRVIRQEDGKDARLFTDTKDRIFDVAIATTAADPHAILKEAILGAGVGGTVYWVQIKRGDRDHLDDPNPEQNYFALPPLGPTEPDTSNGQIKTRMRTSSAHPEYFAIGRGRHIHIVWPHLILEQNLLVPPGPGRDRIVDVDRLLAQSSLKIGMGKACKDFAFSPDDTAIVSVGKSGHAEFWDVRSLTAARADSDPRAPMPANAFMEVKEPVMTLVTTPEEGEKMWPSSVLLLDKLRPYQKRTALRYMIIGMRQNHTLQLWDLALGKSVQEFHLPYIPNSNAFCSIMYHPPTGMIVVGHPTRNSIYFLHLSAPKYTLKNISQIEYMYRLVTRDPAIPSPASTAVISGIREYSFANKGVLRSLSILANPSTTADAEDAALFELYAMHSKGVTCIQVRRPELGWSNENKVVSPVDAVESGYVTISKLQVPEAESESPARPATQQQPVATFAAATTPTQTPTQSQSQTQTQPRPKTQIASRSVNDREETSPPVTSAASPPSPQLPPPAAYPHTDESKPLEQKSLDSVTLDNKVVIDRNNRGGADDVSSSAPERWDKRGGRKRKPAATAVVANTTATPRDMRLSPRANRSHNNNSNGVADLKRVKSPGLSATSKIAMDVAAQVKAMESRLEHTLSTALDQSFDRMSRAVDDCNTARDLEQMGRYEKLLAAVSDALNENVEKVLKKIVCSHIDAAIIPVVHDGIRQSIDSYLGDDFHVRIGKVCQREMGTILPAAVEQAYQQPEFVKNISERVTYAVMGHVHERMTHAVNADIMPALTHATQRATDDVLRRVGEEMRRLEQQRRQDAAKIEQLSEQTTHLANTLSTMAAAQAQFQQEFLALRQELREQRTASLSYPHALPAAHGHASSRASGASNHHPGSTTGRELTHYRAPGGSSLSAAVHPSSGFSPAATDEEEAALRDICHTVEQHMMVHNYDDAMMRWLQAGALEDKVFKRVLARYDSRFLYRLSPLLLLSVGATVSALLDGDLLAQKLTWMDTVILSFHQQVRNLDSQTRDVTPKIMSLMKTRIEQLFVRISRQSPHDAVLKSLSSMASVINSILELFKNGV